MKTCIVDGCDSKILAKKLCSRHWQQMKHHGKIIRTRHDENVFLEINKDTMAVIIDHKPSKSSYLSFFDKEDYGLIKKYKWHLTYLNYSATYEKTSLGKRHRRMHQILFPKNKVTDHINRNVFDNRKSNLRSCTQCENLKNKNLRSDNKSGATGVTFHSQRAKWQVKIAVNEKWTHVGLFEKFEDAANSRLEAERKHYGQFAPQKYKLA